MKYKPNRLLWLSLILYSIGLLGCSYSFIGKNVFGLSFILNQDTYYLTIFTPVRRIFLMGLPFYAIGCYLSTILINYTKKQISIINILSIIGFLIEIYSLKKLGESNNIIITIGLIPLTTSTFILFTKLYSNIKNAGILSQYSSGIYFVHPFFITLISVFMSKVYNVRIEPTTNFILTAMLSIFFVFVIKKADNRLLNKLIA